LEQRGIITRLSLQTDAIRASMAFFTTPSDVDTLIDGLADLRA
jgi:selenocysteine lyase/cysteine desulfurase